jgi:hypothetical protein
MRVRPGLWAAALLPLLLAPAARADETALRDKAKKLAEKVVKFLKAESADEVAVGDVVGPPDHPTSAGQGLAWLLGDELKKQKINVSPRAALKLEGRWDLDDENDRKDELIVRLTLWAVDRAGRRKAEFTEDLTYKAGGNAGLIRLLGMQADLSKKVKTTPQDQNVELKRQLAKPPLSLDETRVKTTKTSPYAVEILVKPQGATEFKAVAAKDKDGLPFVELKKGDEYGIRLRNHSKYDAAVSLAIDGIDAFAFWEAEKGRPRHFLVGPGKVREVKGWMRSTTKVSAFRFGGPLPAAVLVSRAKQTQITVCFHAAWTGRTPPPEFDGVRCEGPQEIPRSSRDVQWTIGPLMAAVTVRAAK